MLPKPGFILFAMLLLVVSAAYATQAKTPEAGELEKQSQLLDETASSASNENTYEALSSQLGVSVEELMKQKQDTKFGFGQLFIANALAKTLIGTNPDLNFAALAQQFQDGKGWGVIAKENGVKLGPIVSQIKRSTEAIEHARNTQVQGGQNGSGKNSNRTHSSNRQQGQRAVGHGRN